MGFTKINPNPNEEKKTKSVGLRACTSMNHFRFMKINDHINFF